MVITKTDPPNLAILREAFNLPDDAVYTWGQHLHSPNPNVVITDDLIIHETVHSLRQGYDPSGWWDRFIKDKEFRLNEELQAYRNQYHFYYLKTKDRERRSKFLWKLATDLSSRQYGCIIPFTDALIKIRNGL